jgi:phospholipid transport system substrate-binding protein
MPLRRSLSLLIVLVALVLPVAGVRAAAPSDAQSFINDLVSQALDMLRNKQMPIAERDQKFSLLLTSDFDIPRISRFVLGRYWTTASDEERTAFARLFERWIVRTYSARFSDYSGETIKVNGMKPQGETDVIVESELIHTDGGPPAKIDWRVRHKDDGFKIVDIDVEGVSMALTQKEEFASVIQNSGGSVAGLNRAIEQKLAANETATPSQ